MDDLLRDEVEALRLRHGLSPEAVADLSLLLDKLLDSRFLSSIAAPDPTPAPGGGGRGLPADLVDQGLLGRGSMGEVRQMRDRSLERVVALKRLLDPRAEAWFAQEMRILASLEHPGVVPIFQAGTMADGTPWFTMRQIQGRTLAAVLPREAQQWPLRRRVEILRRVADTLGYAHARGIVHRDVKPANILLGTSGEVMLADWGLALPLGAGEGRPSGTPAYMAPEQERGASAAPSGDVWSMGLILVELLTGQLPPPPLSDLAVRLEEWLVGRCPPELAAICRACLAAAPEERLPDGAAISQALGDWLDGVRREEEARAALQRALVLREEAQRARAESVRLREAAAAFLRTLETWRPAADKLPGWTLEDQAAALEIQALVQEEAHLEALGVARERAPLPEIHAALSDWHHARFLEAQAAQSPTRIAVARQRLATLDPPRLRAWEQATGALTLLTDPPGATVTAAPYVLSGRRLVPGPSQVLGRTPLHAVAMPAGSWLLTLTAPGRHPLRYPVLITRYHHWDGVPPGQTSPYPIYLPRTEELGPEDHPVPAGWCTIGHPQSLGTLPPGPCWVDGFVARRHTLTNGELVHLLNWLAEQGRAEEAMAMAPRERSANLRAAQQIYGFDGRRFFLTTDSDGDFWKPRMPVMMISHHDARAICAAFAEESGLPWRLPTAREIEKASRGVDARAFPWGDQYDHSFSCRMLSHVGNPYPPTVDAFPLDESPYGIQGLYGITRTWTSDPVDATSGLFYQKGSYFNAHGNGHLAIGSKNPPTFRGVDTGLRLVRSLG